MKGFECKLYCNLLRIKFEEFNKLSLKQQINLIENLDNEKINSSSVLADAKQKLLEILSKEREEEIKFNKEQAELEKMLDKNSKKPQNSGEGR